MAQRLLSDKPEFSCAFARRKLFFLKNPEQLDRYVESLLSAGVPEM